MNEGQVAVTLIYIGNTKYNRVFLGIRYTSEQDTWWKICSVERIKGRSCLGPVMVVNVAFYDTLKAKLIRSSVLAASGAAVTEGKV